MENNIPHTRKAEKRKSGFDSFLPLAASLLGLVSVLVGVITYAVTLIPTIQIISLIVGGLVFDVILAFVYRERLKETLKQRRTLEKANIFLFTVIAICILFFINLLGSQLRYRRDMTSEGNWTLSDETFHVLEMIESPVNIYTFYDSDDPESRNGVDLINEYALQQPLINVKHYTNDEASAMAQSHEVEMRTILIENGDIKTKIFDAVESKVTSAIMRAVRRDIRKVVFISGHGELSIDNHRRRGLSETARQLRENGYTVSELLLSSVSELGPDIDCVILMGPRTALLNHESKMLREYLANGGSALMAFDPESSSPMKWIEEDYGIKINDGMVLDIASHLLKDVTTPVVNRFYAHKVTEGISQVFFPGVRSMELEKLKPGYQFRPIADSSNNSYLEKDVFAQSFKYDPGIDQMGPRTMSALIWNSDNEANDPAFADKSGPRRLAFFGDSDFPTNGFQDSDGNRKLMLSLIAWLANDDEYVEMGNRNIAVNTKKLQLPNFTVKMIFFTTTAGFPGLLLIAGLIVWLRRN